MKKILFLTNGHGEDQTAARIIKNLPQGFDISVYPLVGEGLEFKDLNVKILEPRRALPGGGFSLRNFFALPKDLINGLFTLFHSQIKKLISLRGEFDLVVSIGDFVPIVGALLTRTPFIFVGVNKSEYYHSLGFNYTFFEKYILKKYAKKVYARDEITAESLKKYGINAIYAGNPLMDGLTPTAPSGHLPLAKGERRERVIGFLPGTREADIDRNIEDFEKILIELKKIDNKLNFLLALTSSKPRRLSRFPHRDLVAGFDIKPFEDVIYSSDVVIGLSGTGNEQAAGIGKPVVAFVGRGSQYNKKFARAQKQLLGEALALTKREPVKVAEEVWEILNDKQRQEYMANTGQKRMGVVGSVIKISHDISDMLK
ncbi:hypothetical protein HZC34_03560 [Candidatus Saganbacteria bacterium]|nr:hypothetical protein [Candidatus Saganbacteria bacterium]